MPSKYTSKADQWRRNRNSALLLAFVRHKFHSKGIMRVSVNDIYRAWASGELPGLYAPVDARTSWKTIANTLFSCNPLYKTTGEKEWSILDGSQTRVNIWEYQPENDERRVPTDNKTGMKATSWEKEEDDGWQ